MKEEALKLADELNNHAFGYETAMKCQAMIRRLVKELDENQRTIDGDKRLIDLLYEKVETTQRHLTAIRKSYVWHKDITMIGEHSEEYEDGFWDAVSFVRKKQTGEDE